MKYDVHYFQKYLKVMNGLALKFCWVCNAKERGTNNLVILGQPFFHQTTLFFCE